MAGGGKESGQHDHGLHADGLAVVHHAGGERGHELGQVRMHLLWLADGVVHGVLEALQQGKSPLGGELLSTWVMCQNTDALARRLEALPTQIHRESAYGRTTIRASSSRSMEQ